MCMANKEEYHLLWWCKPYDLDTCSRVEKVYQDWRRFFMTRLSTLEMKETTSAPRSSIRLMLVVHFKIHLNQMVTSVKSTIVALRWETEVRETQPGCCWVSNKESTTIRQVGNYGETVMHAEKGNSGPVAEMFVYSALAWQHLRTAWDVHRME